MKKSRIWIIALAAAVIAGGCAADARDSETAKETADVSGDVNPTENTDEVSEISDNGVTISDNSVTAGSLPEELEQIPEGYFGPSDQPGTLTELEYDTYESMTYEDQSQVLHKRAIVYLPYGYSEEKSYNVFYLMHGGWSNETTYLGTPDHPNEFKIVLDNGIADGKIREMIVVCPTYNNTSEEDSSDYSLALRLTENYHNELVNDLIPAVEGTFSTYAEDTTPEGLRESRDHRAFCGFSMGSVATWRTFQYCLDYFRYFMPSSGSLTSDGAYMASLVRESGHDWDDFFIFAASGTDDFPYSSFKVQIQAMADVEDGTFRFADNERDGNLYFLEQEGGVHSGEYAEEYFYNGLCWIWKNSDSSAEYTLTTKVADVINDPVFEDYGRLIFPVDRTISADLELQDVGDILVWYNNVNPNRTVEIANYLRDQAAAGAVIMQYTGLSDVTGAEPPTYACVGTSDGIASYRSMEDYIRRIQNNGTDAQIEVFDGLRHGFGLGEGTVAEGWLDHAVSFWERNMSDTQ